MASSNAYAFLLADPSAPKVCVLGGVLQVPDELDLDVPGPIAPRFPAGACFHMDPDHPEDDRLADVLHNVGSYAVVSQRAKDVLAAAARDAAEYLPVRILDHRGEPVDGAYFIARPLEVIEAIDLEASDVEFHPADPAAISCVDELILDPSAIGEREFFRLRGFPRHPVVGPALQAALAAADLTGLHLQPVAEFEF